MPTYQNRSSSMNFSGEFSFSPGEIKPITQCYLSESTNIVKISDDPPLQNNFHIIFTDVASPTNMSSPFYFKNSAIIHLKNKGPIVVNSTATITAFVSLTDNPEDCIPIQEFNFIMQQYPDPNGNFIGLFKPVNANRLPFQLIDPFSELLRFAVTDISDCSPFDVCIKLF